MFKVLVGPPKESDGTDAPVKPKRKSTPAQAQASRNNASKSTGPRTEAGKAIAKMNGVIHGMASTTPFVLEGEEDEAEIQAKIDRYIIELGAVTEAERDQAELAVHAFFRVRRVRRADRAAEARVKNRVKNLDDEDEGLVLNDIVAGLKADPVATIFRLRGSSLGIHWILNQVVLLEEYLHNRYSFHPSERVRAIQLCGRRPQDLFHDPVVLRWDLVYLSGLHGPGQITAQQAAVILWDDRPEGMPLDEFERRLGELLPQLDDRAQGRTFLLEMLQGMKDGLLERLAVIEQREQIDGPLEIREAEVSANADCMRRLRYQRENERARQGALRELRALQEMRLKYQGVLGEPVAEASPTDGFEDVPAPAAGPATVSRTEAGATQVEASQEACTTIGSDAREPATAGHAEARVMPAAGDLDGDAPAGNAVLDRPTAVCRTEAGATQVVTGANAGHADPPPGCVRDPRDNPSPTQGGSSG
jgi:hypothetical protein